VTDAAPAPAAIETLGLTKRYGAFVALDEVDVRVESGQSVALFGANGAGKTTLLRILGLTLRPSAGRFRIDGLDPRRDDLAIRGRIGFVSHQTFLYDALTTRENLSFFAALYGVAEAGGVIDRLLQRFELTHRAEDTVGRLSHGMRQRVSLARALVHDPPIVFLDEPFTGLDPHAAGLLRATLDGLRRDRRTVVMVTHDLRRGLEMSDRWLLLERGRVRDRGSSPGTDLAALEALYGRPAAPRRAGGAR
jgi:heme exporter protein A